MQNPNAKSRFVFSIARQATFVMLAALFLSSAMNAQTTLFSFEAKLPNEATPATDTFEMEFKVFDQATGGNQIGATNVVSAVEVKNRDFKVQLDFGAAVFSSADRFIEISYRRSGSNQPFSIVSPRRQVLSVPYAIRALTAGTADNALSLNGVDASDFVQTNDPRLFDSRDPNPGSNNYIQNTTTQQSPANFNISGSGTANTLNVTTQYDIGGDRILSNAGNNNVFAGVGAGAVNTGSENAFFGRNAGNANTTGGLNSFFGNTAGSRNTIGGGNSIFGAFAGIFNSAGNNNSFFGRSAGIHNTTGSSNSFFGFVAGLNNAASSNSFFGRGAGFSNTAGGRNAFFGANASDRNTTGGDNSSFGFNAGQNNLTGSSNSFFGAASGDSNTVGNNITIVGAGADVGANNLEFATAIGAGAVVSTNNTIQLGRGDGSDKVRVPGLGAAGVDALCRNASNEISACSSSLRYKTDISPFNFGLNLVNRLHPITFNWKDGGIADLGLGAEDVAAIEPLLVTYNRAGQIEGVKYDRIGVVLLNAVKEQQKQIQQQQILIEGLRKLVCQTNAQADVCK